MNQYESTAPNHPSSLSPGDLSDPGVTGTQHPGGLPECGAAPAAGFSGSCPLLLLLARLVFRSWAKAAIWVSVFLVLFFAYGHLYLLLKTNPVLYPIIGRHRVLVAVALLILAGLAWLLLKWRKPVETATLIFNLIAILLLILPVVQLGNYAVNSLTAASRADLPVDRASTLNRMPINHCRISITSSSTVMHGMMSC